MGLPTLERLIQHPFWQEYVPKFHEQYMSGSDASKFSLKQTNTAKEHIKLATQKCEKNRLVLRNLCFFPRSIINISMFG